MDRLGQEPQQDCRGLDLHAHVPGAALKKIIT